MCVYMCVPVHTSCLKVTFKDVNSSVSDELEEIVPIKLETLGESSRLCLPRFFCKSGISHNLFMAELCLVKEFFCDERHLVVPFVFPGAQSSGRKAN